MASLTDNSIFYCTRCGQKGMFIPRLKGAERKAGHLKRLYCLNCKQEVNHVETKEWTKYDYECFLLEFKYGNFDEEGNRKMQYGFFKDKLVKEGII